METALSMINEILICLQSEYVPHPTYLEQKQALLNVYSFLNKEYVQDHIIKPLGYTIIDFDQLKDGGGVINPIFIITARCMDNKDNGIDRKWLLRVCNPHSYWIDIKTKGEVNTMSMISKYCSNIPIPKIIDSSYSNSCTNKDQNEEKNDSNCRFQYILFELLQGTTLRNVQKDLDIDKKYKVFKQLSSMVSSLQKIPIENKSSYRIGTCFQINDDDDDIQYGRLRQDGPSIGPFKNIIEYFDMHFNWIVETLINNYYDKENCCKSNLYDLKTINNIKIAFDEILSKYVKPLHDEQYDMKYNFNHCDLNASNILIDNTEQCNIIGIIDWEWAKFDPFNDDINTLNDYIKEWKLNIEKNVEMLKTDEISQKLANLNWIKQYGCDMVFFTVTWWNPLLFDKQYDDNKELEKYVIQESQTGFNNLQKKLKEYKIQI